MLENLSKELSLKRDKEKVLINHNELSQKQQYL